jgi:hypothetical protein
MLVVVAIIVLLAAIITPVYETAVKRSETSVCLLSLRHLTTAVGLYADDYDGRCVPARVDGPNGTWGTCWDVLLLPYFQVPGLLLCPSDPMPQQTSGSVSYKHSYGINLNLAMVGGYNGNAQLLERVADPTHIVVFFDINGSARTMGAYPQIEGTSKIDARHGQGANFAFVAGNAKWYRPETTVSHASLASTADMWAP